MRRKGRGRQKERMMPNLISIALTPANSVNLPLGHTLQFTVIGTYSDGSTADLTSQVTYTSYRPNIFSISGTGLVTGLSVGLDYIWATMNVTPVVASNITMVNVVAIEVPTSIAITPSTPQSIAIGGTIQYTATATYPDGSTSDITSKVTWQDLNPNIASISVNGLATGLTAGTTRIAANVGSVISQTVTLQVVTSNLPVLNLINITPSVPDYLDIGATLQFTATGSYSDGSTADITSQVSWTSTYSGVASISTSGLARGIAEGSTSIRASLAGITSMTITLEVVATMPTLTSITVTPTSPASLPVGSTQQFTATGTFSDGTNTDITSQVTWNSSNVTIATISSSGLATGVAAGNTIIKASVSGVISPGITLTVTGVGPTPVKTTDYWESLLPMPPIEGPPLPAFLEVYWPWTKKNLTPAGNLQITVYDADTSLPLPKVAVTAVPNPGFFYEVFGRVVATTDDNGFCSFAVKKGTFSVQCAKMGYITQAIQVVVGDTGGSGSVELAANNA